ncbi:hypothetical protein JTB14_007649 [Gonioctena quinquepunctata]|nr:hypothetical protein JTB14_007649 [Gonioctena quinquepunctata]
MGEKFNIRTASNLLLVINDNEESVKQLIDAIELNDSLSDNDGKSLLTKYGLKTRLPQSAKMREDKSVDEFGKSIEQLLVNLTIAQSEGNDEAMQVLKGTNEKIALDVFANGLRNHDLRETIAS